MKTIQIKTTDYSQAYGGVAVIIDGKEASFGSVVGYSLYGNDCPITAVARAKKNGHALHWINLSATVMCSDKGYYERKALERAAMPKLSTGDIVRYEGRTFKIVPANNGNFHLEPVRTKR